MVKEKFSIGELANLAGISRRAVRYYVQVGILQPPQGAGRGHYYTRHHLETLQQIHFWQEEGLSLDLIRERLSELKASTPTLKKRSNHGRHDQDDEVSPKSLMEDGNFQKAQSEFFAHPATPSKNTHPPGEALPASELWVKVPILEGLELMIKSGTHRITPGRIARLTKAVREIFQPPVPESSTREEKKS